MRTLTVAVRELIQRALLEFRGRTVIPAESERKLSEVGRERRSQDWLAAISEQWKDVTARGVLDPFDMVFGGLCQEICSEKGDCHTLIADGWVSLVIICFLWQMRARSVRSWWSSSISWTVETETDSSPKLLFVHPTNQYLIPHQGMASPGLWQGFNCNYLPWCCQSHGRKDEIWPKS